MAGMNLETIDFSDPEQLAQAFEQLEASEPPNEEVKAEKAAATEEKTQQEADKASAEPEPEGVATKDGRHVIPYSVLKSERERATRAEQIAAEMRERVEKLETMVQQGSQGAKQGESARTTEAPESEISQDDLEDLKENFPTVYKAVMGMQAKAQHLESKLQPVEETVKSQAEEQARSNAETVQDAIDSVPKLAHIQANDPAAFELAKQFDATLRDTTAWKDRPISERFAKVAEMVETAMGPIEIPGSKQAPTQAELRKAAEAKAAQAARGRANVPTSLSEFPAGQHAAQDEREAAEQLTPVQLAEKFARMTPEQMDAYFQEL